jgi:hypothetical protein
VLAKDSVIVADRPEGLLFYLEYRVSNLMQTSLHSYQNTRRDIPEDKISIIINYSVDHKQMSSLFFIYVVSILLVLVIF